MGKRGVKVMPTITQMASQADKFPMNPTPDLDLIRRLLRETFKKTDRPFDRTDLSELAFRGRVFETVLKTIAEELGGVL